MASIGWRSNTETILDNLKNTDMTNSCMDKEPFVLRVIGDNMEPEFPNGSIIVVDPGQSAADGDFVVTKLNDQIELRQLSKNNGNWRLTATAAPEENSDITSLAGIIGRVIKRTDARQKFVKEY